MRDIDFIREKVRAILREGGGDDRERSLRGGKQTEDVTELGRLAKENPGAVLKNFGIPNAIKGTPGDVAVIMARNMLSSPLNSTDLFLVFSDVRPISGGVEFYVKKAQVEGEDGEKAVVGTYQLGKYIKTIYVSANTLWKYGWRVDVKHVKDEKVIVRVAKKV